MLEVPAALAGKIEIEIGGELRDPTVPQCRFRRFFGVPAPADRIELETSVALRAPTVPRSILPAGFAGTPNFDEIEIDFKITLCYATVRPGRKSGFRAGCRPDSNRESLKISPPAARRAEFCFPDWKPATIRPGSHISGPELLSRNNKPNT